MLKLEKIAKSRELSVLLRAKPTFFTSPFLFALSYAVFIHVTAFFIFQIAPFKIGYQQTLFPPTSVATDIPVYDGVFTTNTHFEEEESIASYLIAPLSIVPQLPPAKTIPIVRNTEYIKQKSPLNNPFLSLENRFEVEHENFLDSNSFAYVPLTVQLSGSLAEMPFEFGTLENFESGPENSRRTYHFLYSVQLDQDKGEFFWWDLKHGKKNTKAEKYALDVLKGLQFSQNHIGGPVSGEVSINITLACNETCHD